MYNRTRRGWFCEFDCCALLVSAVIIIIVIKGIMGIRRFTATALVLTLFVILCTPVMASEFTGNAADSPFVGILTLYSSTGK